MSESFPRSTVSVFTDGSCAAGVACAAPDIATTTPVAAAAATMTAAAAAQVFRLTFSRVRLLGPKFTALAHRGVEDGHTLRRVGGWDSSRVDEGLAIDGVRKVLHAVLSDALSELEGRRQLLGALVCAKRARWLQLLTGAEGLCPHRGAHTDPKGGKLARRLRVREIGVSVLPHALGELHRLLTGSGGAAPTGGGAAGRCGRAGAAAGATAGAATARADHGDQGDHGTHGGRGSRNDRCGQHPSLPHHSPPVAPAAAPKSRHFRIAALRTPIPPGVAVDGIRFVSTRGSSRVGSGKSFTPLSRMHWANSKAASCSWALLWCPVNPGGSRSLRALRACSNAAELVSSDEPFATASIVNTPVAS